MRSEEVQSGQDSTNRLSSLSIVVDDFDSVSIPSNSREERENTLEVSVTTSNQKPYTRQSSDASIKKILEEAEHRKHEFWKLIDEHNAVIENLKRIEKDSPTTSSVCKLTQAAIKT